MRAGIVGAGAWGTTIAIHLGRLGHEVILWARDPARAARMEELRENERYLKGFRFPDTVRVVSDGGLDCDFLVGGVPTQYMRAVFSRLGPGLPDVPFLSLSKGIEIGTGKLPTQIYREAVGAGRKTAVLTGPCIALEIARGLPTAVVVAGDEAAMFQDAFKSDRFRVYTASDQFGAELVAALKNVVAIAAGIVDGMELGDNAKAALLTRGIVEIARLGTSLGAKTETFTGLAGFGDLLTTCVSPHGRNRTLGERIGRGEKLQAILASTSSVAEGVPTIQAALALAEQQGVEMPITAALRAILFDGVDIREALGLLMTRAPRSE